jgi:SAM-dependent methyltransferase
LGEIENLPVESESVDVVVSKCVLNLVPDKTRAFSEIQRVLRSGGHFSISDIVLEGSLPESIANVAELYASCVSGALDKNVYLDIISKAGFKNVSVVKEKNYNLPDDLLLQFISEGDLKAYRESGDKILSITVYAEKG